MSAPAIATTAVSVRNASVQIKMATLLDGVSIDIASGEWLSIIGPNGAGKSTLLRTIAGVQQCSGAVEIDGQPIASLSPRERAALVSWVPQTPTIPAGMNVLDYVLLGRTPHLNPLSSPGDSDIALAKDVIEDLDLTSLAGRLVDTLSGGERQRVVIGRALVQEAPVILLDEPTSALDLGHQQEVLQLLDRLRSTSGRTIISTMHDLSLAGQFADRLVMIADGKVVASGTGPEVLTAEHIETHYRAAVTITNVDGAVLVVPRIDRPDSSATKET